ncbi:hypothetical protein [Streptomyces sp. NBC_00557]|uniref:hypothetical protein n=1 Tax=Streptomyces sp. NBC_00557 TaxID=2975776 RepID=UPI002E802C41|nr:hypothetical protein [Streptomyces sp. NBC_00557]WUC39533.1 hypothetical protein OG956_37760 [Streptomyces sp. NBC_00557]
MTRIHPTDRRTAPHVRPSHAPAPGPSALDAGDAAGAFAQLRLVELAAPAEARRPSVRALTARIAEHRPGLAAYTHRAGAKTPHQQES